MRNIIDLGRGDDEERPPPDSYTDALNSTSLKNLSDAEKYTFLQNIGYLFGVCVEGVEGPRRSMRPVAKRACGSEGSPFIREMNNVVTETITTKTEREANYVHQGWTLSACSPLSPWIPARIAGTNRPNPDGAWITKRTIVQRLSLNMQLEELVAVPEFEADIEAALRRPTTFEQLQALYRALHIWGDVVPLGIDVGISLSFTDLESNILKLPNTGSYNKIRDLLAIKTLQVFKQGGDAALPDWNDEKWPMTTVPPLQWCQVRVTRAVPTISMLSKDIQSKIVELYAERLSYSPAFSVGTTEGYKTFDDNQYASKTPSHITVRAHTFIDSLSTTYLDRTHSPRHGGGGGTEHQFELANGEHVTDIMMWSNREWVCGIQFRTNTGRISPHYGGAEGTPAVARYKGGVLTAFSSLVRRHHHLGSDLVHRIQGIWRRDLVNKVPNEEEVFSTYLGGGGGTPFNDWAVVGNNSSMHIMRVDIGCWDLVDSIQMTYVDRSNGSRTEFPASRHGGSGGAKKSFMLDPGEHIVSISGRRSDDRIVQLCFETSRGRKSGAYGGSGGEYFSISAPLDSRGNRMRLRYICGKSGWYLDGIMFIWAPSV